MSLPERSAQEIEQLILDYMPVVGYVVSEYAAITTSTMDRADLTQVGYIALVRAAREFDPERGMTFRGFVNLRVRNAIRDELRRVDHLSRRARTRVREFKQVEQLLTGSLKRQPTDDEIATVMGLSVEDVETARNHAQMSSVSLDGLVSEFKFDLADEGAVDPEENALHNERLVYLRAGIDTLPDRLRFVVEATFWSDMNDTEIGEHLGVSRSQVSRLRSEALGLLRDAMHASLDPEMLAPARTKEGGVAERRRNAFYAAVAARAAMSAQLAQMSTSAEASQPVPAPVLELVTGRAA